MSTISMKVDFGRPICKLHAWIAFGGGHGVVPEEAYWNSVFPNNSMPKALKDILPAAKYDRGLERIDNNSQGNDEEFYDWSGKSYRTGSDMFYDWSDELRVFYDWSDEPRGNNEGQHFYDWSSERSNELRGDNRDAFYVWSSESSNKFRANNDDGSGNNVDETVFFFPKDLRSGKLVKLPALTTSDKTPFLHDRVAKSIPFSSDELPEILNHFSVRPQTKEANLISKTVKGCERVAMKGEDKFCATSLESFIDSSISHLGKQIQLLSTELSKETNNSLFIIAKGMQDMGENELVCHKMKYPRAVFLCHSIDKTTVYKVPLVGRDGTKANALAVCHKDTSAWNPKHMAFRILKVKPGTVPICHFLVKDALIWVSN
ncbi:BURP domain protein RD22-like [Hibiscus syriacus]|uniref:BURP domain protein RD22-like n=1 Tax=Hibiscus syriacus TaxID=106335 RepID=UPI001920DC80|nr:BURP domain protein RD22-like [Hibiscus syriacus]